MQLAINLWLMLSATVKHAAQAAPTPILRLNLGKLISSESYCLFRVTADFRLERQSTVLLDGVLQDTNCKSFKSMVVAGSNLMKQTMSSSMPVCSPKSSANIKDSDMQSSLKARVKTNWPPTERTITTFKWKISRTHLLHQAHSDLPRGTKLEVGTEPSQQAQDPLHHQAF